MVLASQALTTQAATGGRLTLGIGSSHRDLVEGALGQSYDRPAARLREFVATLTRTLDGERFAHHGDFVSVDTTTTFGRAHVVDRRPPPCSSARCSRCPEVPRPSPTASSRGWSVCGRSPR